MIHRVIKAVYSKMELTEFHSRIGDCGSQAAMTAKGRVMSHGLRVWIASSFLLAMTCKHVCIATTREHQHFTGLGAWATADMAGKRPLCALGPMMSALILWPFLIKEKGRINYFLKETGQNRPVRRQYTSYSSPKSLRSRFSSLRTCKSIIIMNATNTNNACQVQSQTQTPA